MKLTVHETFLRIFILFVEGKGYLNAEFLFQLTLNVIKLLSSFYFAVLSQ